MSDESDFLARWKMLQRAIDTPELQTGMHLRVFGKLLDQRPWRGTPYRKATLRYLANKFGIKDRTCIAKCLRDYERHGAIKPALHSGNRPRRGLWELNLDWGEGDPTPDGMLEHAKDDMLEHAKDGRVHHTKDGMLEHATITSVSDRVSESRNTRLLELPSPDGARPVVSALASAPDKFGDECFRGEAWPPWPKQPQGGKRQPENHDAALAEWRKIPLANRKMVLARLLQDAKIFNLYRDREFVPYLAQWLRNKTYLKPPHRPPHYAKLIGGKQTHAKLAKETPRVARPEVLEAFRSLLASAVDAGKKWSDSPRAGNYFAKMMHEANGAYSREEYKAAFLTLRGTYCEVEAYRNGRSGDTNKRLVLLPSAEPAAAPAPLAVPEAATAAAPPAKAPFPGWYPE